MTLRVYLFVTLLLNKATGSLHLSPRSAIVGGEDAPPGRWPWMVYLHISDGKAHQSCGGSLVHRQWVLTAGHCLKPNPNLSLSYARLGELKLLHHTSGVRHYFQRLLLHPQYHLYHGVPLNDIALLQLLHPVLNSGTLTPVALPSPRDVDSLNSESECWVTGWGDIAENKPLGDDQTLQQLRLPLVDDDTCRDKYHYINNNHLCAGYLEGGKDTCQGDSGGPLVCKSFGQFVQVGVVSFGAGCGRRDYPGVYTRVYNYMMFIEDAISQYR